MSRPRFGTEGVRALTIVDDDIKESSCLVVNDASQKGHIRLISNIQPASAFLFNEFAIFLGTSCFKFNK